MQDLKISANNDVFESENNLFETLIHTKEKWINEIVSNNEIDDVVKCSIPEEIPNGTSNVTEDMVTTKSAKEDSKSVILRKAILIPGSSSIYLNTTRVDNTG